MRKLAVFTFLFGWCLATATIRYTVEPLPEANRLKVSIAVETRRSAVSFQIPNWAPGSYRLQDFRGNIQDVTGRSDSGAALEVVKVDPNTWAVQPGNAQSMTLNYTAPGPYAFGAVHYSGPATYMYVLDRKDEQCRLQIKAPDGWKVATGLDEVARNTFVADTYDVLADNPVTMGDFLIDTYTSLGKPHTIAYRGAAKNEVDLEHVRKVCKLITESQATFFGGLPYKKYVWHFDVSDRLDGGGGLEHLTSTQIGLASGMGPRCVAVMSHEFFHLWNVKRIRSKPLGPFDYLNLPRTGALWWLEGVTDYYAALLLLRYGIWDEQQFFRSLISNFNSYKNNPARLEVSPYEASWKVSDAADGRGNSNGWRISYYTLGWLVGMCLDIELRSLADGKASLDDVTRALWSMTRDNQPGFEEGAIREECVRVGGEIAGNFYDRIVMKPGEMPIEEQLAKVGLRIAAKSEEFYDIGFDWAPSRSQWAIRVQRPRGPAQGVLEDGDLILRVDGVPIAGETNVELSRSFADLTARATEGKSIRFRVRRGDERLDLDVVPVKATRSVQHVIETEDANSRHRLLRSSWYSGK